MILVSACLAGIKCKYDGRSNLDHKIKDMVAEGRALPFCPEQLGGLPVPRSLAEIKGGDGKDVLLGKAKVVNAQGEDVTSKFLAGAKFAADLAKTTGARVAILKERSPSCGVCEIYDGNFNGKIRRGPGVTTAKLLEDGIETYSEENFQEFPPSPERVYLGVVGAAESSSSISKIAREVGREVASRGAVLVCGGRGGVMEEASRGARENGGVVVGILPGNDRREGNPYLSFSIPTGMGEARNALIARASDGLVAVSGGYGTLSEIALALKMGKPVVGIRSWETLIDQNFKKADSPEEAVIGLLKVLSKKQRFKLNFDFH